MRKMAMSYVEVILTLTIVGIISALIVPGLSKHSQKTEFGMLAKKAYMTLQDVVDNAILTDGPVRNWDFSSATTFCRKYLAPNIELAQEKCNDSYVVSADGMQFSVWCPGTTSCHIWVDTNYKGAPNLKGKDQFGFEISQASSPYFYRGMKIEEGTIMPVAYGGADILMKNNWKFTDKLWECVWPTNDTNSTYESACQ